MNPLYNLGMRAFDAGISLGALKSEKIKKLRIGQKEAIDYLRGKIRPGQPYVWIHAASLGEFEQGRPLIEKIRRGLGKPGFASAADMERRKLCSAKVKT